MRGRQGGTIARTGGFASVVVAAMLAIGSLGCDGCRDVRNASSADAWEPGVDAGARDAIDPDADRDGGSPEIDAETGTRDSDAGDVRLRGCDSSVADRPVPSEQSCGTTVYGTESQFRKTPRADRRLEILVLEATDAFIAPECLYERVEREVETIRRDFLADREPEQKITNDAPPYDGRRLVLHVDDATATAIEDGNYSAWTCLNDHYEKQKHRVVRAQGRTGADVQLTFEGTYDIERLFEAYRGLPGLIERNGKRVRLPRAISRGLPRADIHLCIESRTHYYVFYVEGVQSSSGGYSKYFRFVAPRSGSIEMTDVWRRPPKSEKPPWLAKCGLGG